MRKLITYGLLLAGLMLTMGGAAMASPAEPGAGPDFTATYSYNEECNNEGCSTEEVRELHRSYVAECSSPSSVRNRCSYEELAETAGHDYYGTNIDQMLDHFYSLGYPLLHDAVFDAPVYNGYRLDFCKYWAAECGLPTAEEFCWSNGYRWPARWQQQADIGPTRIIGSNEVCPYGNCDGFRFISCARSYRWAEHSTP